MKFILSRPDAPPLTPTAASEIALILAIESASAHPPSRACAAACAYAAWRGLVGRYGECWTVRGC